MPSRLRSAAQTLFTKIVATPMTDNASSGRGFITLLEAFRASDGTAPGDIVGRLRADHHSGQARPLRPGVQFRMARQPLVADAPVPRRRSVDRPSAAARAGRTSTMGRAGRWRYGSLCPMRGCRATVLSIAWQLTSPRSCRPLRPCRGLNTGPSRSRRRDCRACDDIRHTVPASGKRRWLPFTASHSTRSVLDDLPR